MALDATLLKIATVSTVDFTGSLAQNALATAILTPQAGIAAGGGSRFVLRAIEVTSVENLDWELWLWGKPGVNADVIDSEGWMGYWSFAASNAVQIAGAGRYYYYIDGLGIPYHNLESPPTGKVYLGLVNRSAAGKTAGAGGAIVVKLVVALTSGSD